MMTLTKFYLALAVVCLAVGLLFLTGVISVGRTPALYVIFPTGAVFLGLFLTCRVLEKDTVAFERDQRAGPNSLTDGAAQETGGCECGCHPTGKH